MKAKIRSILLMSAALLYLLTVAFIYAGAPKGMDFIESNTRGEWQVMMAAAAVLLVLALGHYWTQRRKLGAKNLTLPALAAAVLPAAIMAYLSYLSWYGPALPNHVTIEGTKKIHAGMTRSEIETTLGAPRSSTGDEQSHKLRISYDLQIPWDCSKEFYIDLADDKVIRSHIVNFGQEEDVDLLMIPPAELPTGPPDAK